MITWLLEKLGYYRIENLTPVGMCGLCGKKITEILPRDWSYGVCEDHHVYSTKDLR